jgi:hypothetical protein
MSSSNNSAVAKWRKKTWIETIQQTAFGHMAQIGAVYDASDDFRGLNGRGDNITFDYVGKLTGVPLGEGSTAFGNEEALDTGTHTMSINLTRIPVSNPNTGSIEQQRTNIDFNDVTLLNLGSRAAELFDTSVFSHLAGVNQTSFTVNGTTYTGSNRLQVQGHNAPTAPTSNRIIRAGSQSNDESLTTSDTFSMDLLDIAVETITANDQPIDPCSDGYYHLYLHPYQVVDLKQDSAGKIQWYANNLAREQGGKESFLMLPYYTNKPVPVGEYGRVKIYEAPRVPEGQSSADNSVVATARRAVMVGRDAVSFASPVGGLGASDTGVPFDAYVQLSDFDYVKAIDFRSIYGVKKMSPDNAQDIGAFVISTYAAAHS